MLKLYVYLYQFYRTPLKFRIFTAPKLKFLNLLQVVDNLKLTEIVVSFSSLSRWPEPPAGAPGAGSKEESKGNLKRDKTAGGDRDSKADVITESSSVIDGDYSTMCIIDIFYQVR